MSVQIFVNSSLNLSRDGAAWLLRGSHLKRLVCAFVILGGTKKYSELRSEQNGPLVRVKYFHNTNDTL